MQLAKLVGFCILVASAIRADDYEPRVLQLSSLRGCRLATQWIGLWPRMPEGVMLQCGAAEMLVLQPNNLLGHVTIQTPQEALEYVRLFTRPDTYQFFDMQGMVEVMAGDAKAADAPFNVIDPATFKRHFRRAQAEKTDEHACKVGIELACGKEFRIRRIVVCIDQRVYETIEIVNEHGFYTLLAKRLLMKDASTIGILHFGNP